MGNKLWIKKQENFKQLSMKQERKQKKLSLVKEKKLNVNALKECKKLLKSLLSKVNYAHSKLNLLMNKTNLFNFPTKREKQKLIWLPLKENKELLKHKLMKLVKIWNAKENAKQIAKERWLLCLIKANNHF